MKALRIRNHGERARPWREIVYPESDGKPLAETDVHIDQLTYLREALKLWFAARTLVYVAGNNLFYYEEGDIKKRVSPDVYVVKGVSNRKRRVFKLWEEKKPPCVVIEVSSKGTKREDLVTKLRLYRDVLRVKEYYVYDPLREYLPGRLKAWVLEEARYVDRAISGQHIASPELGLILADTERYLRLVDPKTGRELPGLADADAAAREAEARAQAAEAEVRKLREEVRRLTRGKRAR